jgi:hypothetical protein
MCSDKGSHAKKVGSCTKKEGSSDMVEQSQMEQSDHKWVVMPYML